MKSSDRLPHECRVYQGNRNQYSAIADTEYRLFAHFLAYPDLQSHPPISHSCQSKWIPACSLLFVVMLFKALEAIR